MATDKTSGKGSLATFEINDKTIAKSKEVLQSMLDEVKNHAQKKPAETIIKENISIIDQLSKSGVSLPKIYERLNKSIQLGISSASFTQYVRNVRKQVGSELYKELGKRKSKKQTISNNSAATIENISAQLESNSIIAKQNGFQCDFCEKEAEKIDVPFCEVRACRKCGGIYFEENGILTDKQIDENLKTKIVKFVDSQK